MSLPKKHLAGWLKRRINVAKAEQGLNWREIAAEVSAISGKHVSAASLMNKHSRSTFSAIELLFVLSALGVRELEVTKDALSRKQTSKHAGT